MTPEQRRHLESLASDYRGDQEGAQAVRAALVDLAALATEIEMVRNQLAWAYERRGRLCDDLDACRAALEPVATFLKKAPETITSHGVAIHPVCLTPNEADAVLAAAVGGGIIDHDT